MRRAVGRAGAPGACQPSAAMLASLGLGPWSALGPAEEAAAGRRKKAPSAELAAPRRVACGGAHTLYLAQVTATGEGDGATGSKVFGWGGNRHNALGLARPDRGDEDAARRPAKWEAVVGTPSDAAFCDQMQLTEEDKKARQRHNYLDLFAVACGNNHSVIIERLCRHDEEDDDNDALRLTSSRVWSFGLGSNAQLGRPVGGQDADLPAEVPMPAIPGNRVAVQRIACGADHTLAIANFMGRSSATPSVSGRVLAWGLGGYGALGTGTWADEWSPKEIWFPSDVYDGDDRQSMCQRNVVISQVAAGTKHSLAVGDDGSIYTWGHGGNGRLGLGKQSLLDGGSSYGAENVPRLVERVSGQMRYVAAGEAHSASLDRLGGVYTWGSGSHGRCGHGITQDAEAPTRVETLMGVAISQIALGLMHSVAATAKGQLYAWGKGPATGLDPGNDDAVLTPRHLILEHREPVFQIATGPLHTVLITVHGSLYFFGSSSEGRMPFRAVSSGEVVRDQPFPKKLDIKYKGWCVREMARDKDAGGELPRRMAADKDPSWWPGKLFCGGSHSAMLTCATEAEAAESINNLWFWGSSQLTTGTEGFGKQGEGTGEANVGQWKPSVLKRGFRTPVRMVSVGLQHCLAISGDAVCAWGDGSKGQLGTGGLRSSPYPQMLHYPTNVISISAGEETSACIIQGGEAYTWGNADGGRLGQGRTLAEGLQLEPKQVEIGEPDQREAILLRGVSCGVQHTAFISEDDQLLTCGMGWFGRLGNGTMDNKYSPHLVWSPNLRVRDVYCALYHTCIVDTNAVLWVCGRDTSVCRDSGRHQLVPTPFEPFCQEPRKYIQSLATCDQHTLAITVCPDHNGDTELWVWGKNHKAQLGTPEAAAPRIRAPWQLQLPDVDTEGARSRHQLAVVATGPAHSLCLVRPRRPNLKKSDGTALEPMVYSWGCSGSGRLGIAPAQAREQLAELEMANNTAVVPLGRNLPPLLVAPVWKPAEENLKEQRQVAGMDEKDRSAPSECWLDAQVKLWSESQDKKNKEIDAQRHEVDQHYRKFMSDVAHLTEKLPSVSEFVTEYQLRQKESEIEREYIRTITVLGLGTSMSAVRLEGRSKTDQDVLANMHNCEDLVWTLQQQPLYMANLASHFHSKRADDTEVEVFHRICSRLYLDMRERRTRNLFKALMRLLIEAETSRVSTIEEMYDLNRSRVATLFTQMCTNTFFFESLATPILDPQDENSLVSAVIRYTITRDGEAPRTFRTGDAKHHNAPEFTGVFTTSFKEYEELMKSHRALHRKNQEVADDQKRRMRQHFQDEEMHFAAFCAKDMRGQAGRSGKVAHFVKYFVTEVLKAVDQHKVGGGNSDIRMLLVVAFATLVEQPRLVIGTRSLEDSSWLPNVCSPIASLVLGSILGGVLNAVETGPFSLLRFRIMERVRELESEIVDKYNRLRRRRDDAKGEAEAIKDTDGLMKRVFWNIQALAKFFQNVYNESHKFDGVSTRNAITVLRDVTNESLLEVLKSKQPPGGKATSQACGEYGEDSIETDLSVDLYSAHLSLRQSVVRLSTVDLMELTNLLWKYMEPSSRFIDNGAPVRINSAKQDRVCQLVRAILPRKKLAKGVVSEEVVPWTDGGHIWMSRQHGEWHNFRMRSRFLEFSRTGLQEPTFCEDSKVPIPMYLARESQPRRSTFVKPFRLSEETGPRVEIEGTPYPVYAYDKLEEILQELAGNHKESATVRYPVRGHSFPELRSEFEFIQQRLSGEIEEGRAHSNAMSLVQSLEDGKHIVERISSTEDRQALLGYIDRQIQHRATYSDYLRRMKDGVDEILKAKTAYRAELKDQLGLLAQVAMATMTCELPEEVLAIAQQKSERLTFQRAKWKKLQHRKDRPTPAQVVLETLRRASEDGKVTEQMKEMVSMPARSFRLKQLIDKGVVVKLNETIRNNVREKMVVNFLYKDEGYVVQVLLRSTLLKEFVITRQDVKLTEAGFKNAVLPYGDEFLWVNCFRLRRLLAFIAAEGGL